MVSVADHLEVGERGVVGKQQLTIYNLQLTMRIRARADFALR